jgi:hypothetical protein
MPVRVINRSRNLLSVPLNSGETVHLAPNESSRRLDDVEVAHNRWVEDLLQRQWLAVVSLEHEDKKTKQ